MTPQAEEAQSLVLNNSVVVQPRNTSLLGDDNHNDVRFMYMSQGTVVANNMAPWNTSITFNATMVENNVTFVQDFFSNYSCKDTAEPYLSFAAYNMTYVRISGTKRYNNDSLTVLLKDAIVFLGWQNMSVIPASLQAVNNSGFDYIIVWSLEGETEQTQLTVRCKQSGGGRGRGSWAVYGAVSAGHDVPNPCSSHTALPPCHAALQVNGKEFKFTNFDKYSLSNIPAGSAKMWAHVVALWLVTLFTMWVSAVARLWPTLKRHGG